ncbi:4-phosphoerythronate dehydrogenase [Kiritimatiella glycovorans]|uniref:Erythronate-4-phosphate dehydrogenase n=1 Tax=Kiritimatiella glycovorans TaxID=1307763 RepID=A0A0G3EC26_9BACT|nr:4-phosphoerythronate dehydrogenase [Kiritimatiella glycovorans]AKJ63828.1 Erythronate-4-phosphate dehydrogenase [Kiritimatiella glycovorans]
MNIVVAETVLLGEEAFSTLGEVQVVPDREIAPYHLKDADALIIRSKTRVHERLLAESPVRFVGTATAGFDHLDTRYLDRSEIAWCAAPGCNANSVAEYLVAALLELHHRHGIVLEGRSIGIVGVGEVGSRVAEKAEALGMRVLINDPPLEAMARTPDFSARVDPQRYGGFRPLDEVLARSEIVTLHVPLTDEKPWPTRGLARCPFFENMRPGSIFINTCRGEVVDPEALTCALDNGIVEYAVLDVWDPEPEIPLGLLERAELGTPHIAGYSWEGALNGTVACYHAACRFFERSACWPVVEFVPDPPQPRLELETRGRDREDVLAEAVRSVYDIARDDATLREYALPDDAQRGSCFDRLRREYDRRREFFNTRVRLRDDPPGLAGKLRGIGFKADPE